MSEVKVNKISPRTNCGTVQLGDSGDTITIPAGATIVNNGTQTGFGRTGTVDWDTTPKTANFTAANGTGYFVNTTSGAVTMTMPSGSAGAIVSIQDYNKTFDTNNLTVTPASGEKINGGQDDGSLIISTEGQGLTFVYVDSTVGWKTVHENQFISGGTSEIIATGGTITTCGNCKIHTFTGPGTFCVSQISSTPANNEISYMVVAGGGSGGSAPSTIRGAGGGGAGGFREDKSPVTPYTASPLDGAGPITITATSFPITVGAGGTGSPTVGCNTNGSNSVFSTITSAGGGKGGSESPTSPVAKGTDGGSGGGGGVGNASGPEGFGNTPPVSPAQGLNGGSSSPPALGAPFSPVDRVAGGGGGGATAQGTNGQAGPSLSLGGNGGAGATTSISGSPTIYAGGGGGSAGLASPGSPTAGNPGPGGGGAGDDGPSGGGSAGTTNTGGGGGGGVACGVGYSGGSGIVIIRYKYQ